MFSRTPVNHLPPKIQTLLLAESEQRIQANFDQSRGKTRTHAHTRDSPFSNRSFSASLRDNQPRVPRSLTRPVTHWASPVHRFVLHRRITGNYASRASLPRLDQTSLIARRKRRNRRKCHLYARSDVRTRGKTIDQETGHHLRPRLPLPRATNENGGNGTHDPTERFDIFLIQGVSRILAITEESWSS